MDGEAGNEGGLEREWGVGVGVGNWNGKPLGLHWLVRCPDVDSTSGRMPAAVVLPAA